MWWSCGVCISLGGWWCSCVAVKAACSVAKRGVVFIYKDNVLALEYLVKIYLATLNSLLFSFMAYCLVYI